MPNQELTSNIKHITSGVKPTTTDLPKGHVAFGTIHSTNPDESHLYGNAVGEVVDLPSSTLPPFVYYCTGVNDSAIIANIVNEFFKNGTAMSMKLIISGNMGIVNTTGYSAIRINGNNIRGAVCHLDFTDCSIPETNDSNLYLLDIGSDTAKIHVIGLNIKGTMSGLAGGNCCNFVNCTMNSIHDCNNNIFINCKLMGGIAEGVGARGVSYGTGNRFNGCEIISTFNGNGNTFTNCTIKYTVNGGDNLTFNNCKISSEERNCVFGTHNSTFRDCIFRAIGVEACLSPGNYNTFINCEVTAIVSSVWGGRYNTYTNCVITSTYYTVQPESHNSFSNCRISGDNVGVICNTIKSIKLHNCIIIGDYNSIEILSGNMHVELVNCTLKGDLNDLYNTNNWHITGCKFSKAQAYINGTIQTDTTDTITDKVYMPRYANQFNVAID